jgi:transcriptional regulator with XRE-family HTH domain
MDDQLVRRLRAGMREQHLSMRALARRAGVSHSALSRLLARRSRPTTRVVQAMATALGIPTEALVGAAAAGPGQSETVWGLLRDMGMDPAPAALIGQVRADLARMREYAATDEGLALVRDAFERKLVAIGARGPVVERLRTLTQLYLQVGHAPEAARIAAGSAALYFLHAMDAIDDFMWPIGYLDDAVAIALADADVQRALGEGPPDS